MRHIFYWTSLICWVCVGCKPESEQYQTQYKNKLATSEDRTFTQFAQILAQSCPTIEGCDIAFEPNNTRFLLLSPPDAVDSLFVAESSIECGCMAGSCGNHIQLLQKKGKKWSEVYNVCGYNIEVENQKNSSHSDFGFYVRGYNGNALKISTCWKQEKVKLDTLLYGDLPFPLFKRLQQLNPDCTPIETCNLPSLLEIETHPTCLPDTSYWIVRQMTANPVTKWYIVNPHQDYEIVNVFEGIDTCYTKLIQGKPHLITETPFKMQTWKWENQHFEKISEKAIR